jgi:hypothetical protein
VEPPYICVLDTIFNPLLGAYLLEFFAGSDSSVFIPDRVRPSGAVPWDRSVEIHAGLLRSNRAMA